MNTFAETMDYLYRQLPMFTRMGAAAIKKDLTNTRLLCEALGNPHTKFPCVHIGGTNGKGSVSSMLAAIFTSCGYKTGLYTSPHLKSFTERIRIDGKEVPETFITAFVNRNLNLIETVEPSFFEITLAMAFAYFEQEKVDIAMIEVGLGGRLDSTNIILPELSIITNIGYDHTDLLGETLGEIAFEKAGIIKQGVPVVVGEKHPESEPIFIHKANIEGSPLYFAEDNLKAFREDSSLTMQEVRIGTERFTLDLTGDYQLKNIVTVICSVECLRRAGWHLPQDKVKQALSQVKVLSGLKGRMEVLGQNPLIIADTGHNEPGILYVISQIKKLGEGKTLRFVWGMVKDKAHEKVLKHLPHNCAYYFVCPDIPRGLPASEMQKIASYFGLKGEAYPSVNTGLKAALAEASPDDLIFVGGSTFVVAEVV